MDLLLHVLENEEVDSVLVFSRTKHRADRIVRKLKNRGYAAVAMHSNRTQRQRERALEGFRDGTHRILVATDIAARGIDVENVSHVINHDTPRQADSYIHRIGRTGRAEATGVAVTFVAEDEREYLQAIEKHTGQRLPLKVYDGFDGHEQHDPSAPLPPKRKENRGGGGQRGGGRRNNGRRRR
jgi:ATP-dependent RNA helicase RhlE